MKMETEWRGERFDEKVICSKKDESVHAFAFYVRVIY